MNAGANYVDEPLVIDGNLITSRVPGDLPQFNEALASAGGADCRGRAELMTEAVIAETAAGLRRPSTRCAGCARRKAWILDMDGVLYRGAEPLPGVKELLDALTLRERPVMLATNNSMSTPEAYERKLAAMGLDVPAERRHDVGARDEGLPDADACPRAPASTSSVCPRCASSSSTGTTFHPVQYGEEQPAAVVVGLDLNSPTTS